MRQVRTQTNTIVWHCSATKPDWNGHADDIATMHKAKGWDDIGYHIVLGRDGINNWGEDPKKQGAHAKGINRTSLAVCLVGGVDENGKPENNFTPEQWAAARATYLFLTYMYPSAEHVGHRDLSPDLNNDGRIDHTEFMKQCPCFSVKEWIENDLMPVKGLTAAWEVDIAVEEPDAVDADEAEALQETYFADEDEIVVVEVDVVEPEVGSIDESPTTKKSRKKKKK